MKKFTLYCTLLLMSSLSGISLCYAQSSKLHISGADAAMETEAKPLLILLSARWCKYCHLQQAMMMKDKNFQVQSDRFYFVVFDAESTDNVRFGGQDYRPRRHGAMPGIHELAVTLNGSEVLVFPTWILLDRDYRVMLRINGVLSPEEMAFLLNAVDEAQALFLQKRVDFPVE